MSEAPNEITLISVIGDIRIKSGVGVFPMLSELADAVGCEVSKRDARIAELEKRHAEADKWAVQKAMAANPREWCLNRGTVSGDGQCHCNDEISVSGCIQNAVHAHEGERNALLSRIAELEAALRLFVKYDRGPIEEDGLEIMLNYNAAIEAAKAAMKDKAL